MEETVDGADAVSLQSVFQTGEFCLPVSNYNSVLSGGCGCLVHRHPGSWGHSGRITHNYDPAEPGR